MERLNSFIDMAAAQSEAALVVASRRGTLQASAGALASLGYRRAVDWSSALRLSSEGAPWFIELGADTPEEAADLLLQLSRGRLFIQILERESGRWSEGYRAENSPGPVIFITPAELEALERRWGILGLVGPIFREEELA